MPVWVLEFDNGKGESWEYFFGTRREALACWNSGQYVGPDYNKRFSNRRDFEAASVDGTRKEGDCCIWKCQSTGPYLTVWKRWQEMKEDD